jgi:uncharacterized protein YkwD
MSHSFTEGQAMVAPRHRAGLSARPARRTKRLFGSAALAVITAAVVVLPMQGPADAAPTTASASVHNVTAASALSTAFSGATSGLFASRVTASGYTRSVYEARLHVWANRVRAAHGIRPIAVRPCHDGYAERWTGYLVRNGEFRHQDLGAYMSRCKLSKAGEILAMGSVTPNQMVRMWMHSPDHRRILLDRSYGLSGIAARRDANGNWIGCIDFGRRL